MFRATMPEPPAKTWANSPVWRWHFCWLEAHRLFSADLQQLEREVTIQLIGKQNTFYSDNRILRGFCSTKQDFIVTFTQCHDFFAFMSTHRNVLPQNCPITAELLCYSVCLHTDEVLLHLKLSFELHLLLFWEFCFDKPHSERQGCIT